MPESSESARAPNLLGKFASIIGLLGGALFFTGWIYRWSYFAFFKLDVTHLTFPAQSFLIASIQVFLGSPGITLRSIFVVILTIIGVYATLWLLQNIGNFLERLIKRQLESANISSPQRRINVGRILQILTNINFLQQDSLKTIKSFLDEVVTVAWIFIILFWVARWQGYSDAWRDAQQQTSTLPVVSLITSLENLPLGRQLEDVFVDPPLKGFGVIGDKGLFDVLRGKEDTDITNPNQPRVWRLLLDDGGWIYLFIALPPNTNRNIRPSVVAVREGGGQVMILSPEASQA